MILPATLAVQRPRSERPPHAVPNVALPWPLMLRVTPAGQVTGAVDIIDSEIVDAEPAWDSRPGRAGLTRSTGPRSTSSARPPAAARRPPSTGTPRE
jgi:hypothetical protein